MVSSRDISELRPPVQVLAKDFLARCKAAGIDILVTCTYRDAEEQDRLYAIGRTTPGKKVTNAKAGQSFHNFRCAFDCVPLRHGKPVWGTAGADGELWNRVGEIGVACGLEWAGKWTRFREYPHFQYTGGKPLSYFQNGGKI